MALITGNTYPHRAALTALGGVWNPLAKGWEIPAAQAPAAQALVESLPPGSVGVWSPRAPHPGDDT